MEGIVRAGQPGRRCPCLPTATSRAWISRRALSTAARSRNWRAARTARSSTSPARPCSRQSRPRPRRPATEQARRRDTGYILLAGGRRAFETAIGYRLPLRSWAARLNRSVGIGGYLAAISAVAAILLAAPLLALSRRGLNLAVLGVLAALGAIPAIDAAVALVNRGVNARLRRDSAARPGAARRRSRASAHARRGADAADDAGRRSKSRSSGWRSITSRAPRAICISRCSRTGPTPRPNTPKATQPLVGSGGRGVARLNLRYGPAPGGRPLPAAASPPGLERRRSALDRLGTQARQAARIEPAAARRDRHQLSWTWVRNAGCPADVRYVVTLDADTRLPRDTVRRLIGKMAHPLNRPRFDADGRPRRRRLRRLAAARHAVAADRPGRFAVPAHLLERERHRPLRLGGLRRLSGSVRRRLLRRQGHLRRRRVRGRARRPRAELRRLLSHDLFEGVFARAGLASDVEVVEEFPARYDVGAFATTAGRAATGSCCRGFSGAGPRRREPSRHRATSGDRPLEDARQSASHALGARGRPRLARRLDAPVSRRLIWTGFVVADDRAADADSGRRRDPATPPRGDAIAAIRARSGAICAWRQSRRR